LKAFWLCESGLSLVGSQKNLALEQQRARDVQEIDGPRTVLLRMRCGQFAGSDECRIHVQSDLLEGSSFQELVNTGQSRVSLAHDLATLAGWSHALFVKGAMADRVFKLQRVQLQVEEPRSVQAAILGRRFGATWLVGQEFN
jgi:hypothetical protein